MWDADSGQELLNLRGHAGIVHTGAYGPDGRRIASIGIGEGTVREWDADSGLQLRVFRGHLAAYSAVAYSPDGRRIAGACENGTVVVWDADSGQELLVLRGDMGSVFAVAFSPDGQHIAAADRTGTVRVWDGTQLAETEIAERRAPADRRWEVWQRQETSICEQQEIWFAALWHLNQSAVHPKRTPGRIGAGTGKKPLTLIVSHRFS